MDGCACPLSSRVRCLAMAIALTGQGCDSDEPPGGPLMSQPSTPGSADQQTRATEAADVAEPAAPLAGQGGPDEPMGDRALPAVAEAAEPAPPLPGQGTGSEPTADSVSDGPPPPADACPADPDKTAPGDCGCGVADDDGDLDGMPDCVDGCPEDSTKTEAGDCGCGAADADEDDDGVVDCLRADDELLCIQGGADGGCDCTGKVVHFVYFVEADATFSESQRDDVEQQAYAFQEYWYEQLGVTFFLNDPVVDVIEADHDADWYLNTPDGIHGDSRWYRLGNVKTEVYDKLGIRDFDSDHRVVNYPTSRHDGRVGGNFGGAWMDGDDLSCMAGDNGGVNYPYADGAAAHCLGHVVHEFGHVHGLDHEGPSSDCMQYGFYNNSGGDGMCSFSDANVAKILATSANANWFEATPGQRCLRH